MGGPLTPPLCVLLLLPLRREVPLRGIEDGERGTRRRGGLGESRPEGRGETLCLWPVGRWVAECDWRWKGGGRSSRLGVPPSWNSHRSARGSHTKKIRGMNTVWKRRVVFWGGGGVPRRLEFAFLTGKKSGESEISRQVAKVSSENSYFWRSDLRFAFFCAGFSGSRSPSLSPPPESRTHAKGEGGRQSHRDGKRKRQ